MQMMCCSADSASGGSLIGTPRAAFHDLLRALEDVHQREVSELQNEIRRLDGIYGHSQAHGTLITAADLSTVEALPHGAPRVGPGDVQLLSGSVDVPTSTLQRSSAKGSGQASAQGILARLDGVDQAPGTRDTANKGPGKKQKIANIDLDTEEPTRMEQFLTGPLDICMSAVILTNAGVFFAQLYFAGVAIGLQIGTETLTTKAWPGSVFFFFVLEHIFHSLYIVELGIRIVVLRRYFFVHKENWEVERFNIFDLIVVVLGCFDLYLLPLMGIDGSNIGFLRLIRLARLSRTLKVIRVLKVFSKLRVLVSTMASSFMALFWSMFLLLLLIFINSLFLCQILQGAFLEVDIDYSALQIIYSRYGTPPRAFWTMFEVTLGGEGTGLFRLVIEHVHWTYSIFFGAYISSVVFAIICIIQALFLKDTLEIAANDAEVMVQEHLQAKREYSRRLHELFTAADVSGDGLISLQEFEAVISNPKVQSYLHILELEISEVVALFNMLANGDGSISYDEFLAGVLRLKGQARSMDVVAVMSDCGKILEHCQSIEGMLKAVGPQRGPQR